MLKMITTSTANHHNFPSLLRGTVTFNEKTPMGTPGGIINMVMTARMNAA